MSGLYAEETIEINASPEKVWDVLTQADYTKQWVDAFQPVFASLTSMWKNGSRVEWRSADGKILVDGVVTKVSPFEKLAFTVHDASGEFDDIQSDEDSIVYALAAKAGKTLLTARQGDFSKVGEKAQEFRDATAESWSRVLPVVK